MNLKNNYQEVNLNYCHASTTKRFTNYIIDVVVFYVLMFCIGILIRVFKPNLISGLDELTLRLWMLLFYALAMFAIETLFKGKSIGKLITGTKAVNADGSDMGFQKTFIRNIVKAIPFNPFSALGRPCTPWHDSWSDTIVIEAKKLALHVQKIDFFDAVKNQTQ
mgnify:CR=1 FL=1